MKKFLFVFILALFFAPVGAHAALSSTNRVESTNMSCTGTFNKNLSATGSTFDSISTSELPANYATVDAYCIQRTEIKQCFAAGGGSAYSYALYNTSAANAYTSPPSCTLPTGLDGNGEPYEKTSPPKTIKSTLRYLVPTASLTSSPSTIYQSPGQNQNVLLTWSSTNASTCAGTGFNTNNAVSGSVSITPSQTTTYSVSCSGASDTETVTVVPALSDTTLSCSASPTSVSLDDLVTWVANVTGGVPPYSYLWAGDEDLAEATTQDVEVSYSTSGEKSGTVTVTDSSEIPSSTTVNSTFNWSEVCTGTPTGYGESDIQDGGSYQQWRTHVESHSQWVVYAYPPAAANPQDYCVQANLTANCPPTQSGTCYFYMNWDVVAGNGTATYSDWEASTQVDNGQDCSQSWTAPYCYQEFGGTRTYTVSNTPSSGPIVVTKQCSNTVTVNGGPTTPTFTACPSSATVGTAATFTLSASDPDGDQIHYGISWTDNQSVDQWKTGTTTYVNSGTSQSFTRIWNTPGAYTVGGVAEDTGGNQSGWAQCSVTVTEPELEPECSDNDNNDPLEDDDADYPADPGCTSPTDPTESPNPSCSNGSDDDGDGLVDIQDPGCHSDGSAGSPPGYNSGTYTPGGTSEAAGPLPECSDGINNDGMHGTDYPVDPGCESAVDDNESLPQPSLSLTVLFGDLIRPQTRATILWTTAGVTPGTCSVTGDNIPLPHDQWFGDAGQEQTSILANQTVYTLQCLDLAGVATSTTRIVKIAPSSGEE